MHFNWLLLLGLNSLSLKPADARRLINPRSRPCLHSSANLCCSHSAVESMHLLPGKPVEVQLFVSGGFLITTSEGSGLEKHPEGGDTLM